MAVVKLLLSNGVSCDVKSSKSGTPRDVAAAFDNEDVVGAIDAHQAALDVKQVLFVCKCVIGVMLIDVLVYWLGATSGEQSQTVVARVEQRQETSQEERVVE